MDIKEIKELIELINSSDIAYLEIETNDGHIKMDKSLTRNLVSDNGSKSVTYIEEKEEIKRIENKKESVKELVEEVEKDKEAFNNLEGIIITSPMVGTFYSASSPDSDPFVKVGDKVKSGDILCIIEAMKLMNEIESEFNGEVIEVLVKDGDMVEYGTPIFKIKEVK
jgi:acetyl-CoA carboxylase biotin carboxyl carrier protein